MPTKSLTLTIVIPVYNEERYLRACLLAVLAQTTPPDEVIVVDNNSTDASLRIAKSFGFVRVVSEPRQGVLFARNHGFNMAGGDIVARIDADSRLPKDWVSRVKQAFGDPKLTAITGPAGGYDLPWPSLNWLPHHLLSLMLKNLPPTHPFLYGFNMAVRRSAWQKVVSKVCLDASLHEDIDLAIHLHQAGCKLAFSRQLRLQASGRRYADSFKNFSYYMRVYRQTFQKHGYNDWLIHLASNIYWLGYFMYRPWTRHWRPRKQPIAR